MQAPRWVLIWRSQGKKKNLLGFRARAYLELAVWLQAGEDRAIAAGSRAD
jgi:hypothetical protein